MVELSSASVDPSLFTQQARTTATLAVRYRGKVFFSLLIVHSRYQLESKKYEVRKTQKILLFIRRVFSKRSKPCSSCKSPLFGLFFTSEYSEESGQRF